MFHNMQTTLAFAGETVGATPLGAGIRQGCPLSGTLLSLAVDPLVRMRLACTTLRSARLSLCADDLAVMLMQLVEQLVALTAVLAAWAQASGMTLNERKCVVLPTSMSTETTKEMLQRVGLLTNAVVATSARYLGVEVGIDAHVVQWESVAPKVARRSLDVRASTQGIAARLRLFNNHIATMLLHEGRYAELDRKIEAQMRHALQSLTKAPWMAMPPVVLQSMKLLGSAVEARDDAADNLAARIRLAVRSPDLPELWRRIDAAADNDKALLDPALPWHAMVPLVHLRELRNRCLGLVPTLAGTIDTAAHRQVYAAFRGAEDLRRTELQSVMRRRGQRWDEVPEALVGALFAWAATRPPSELVNSVLLTLLYGWCTEHHFGRPAGECVLGCGLAGADRQAHYLACPLLRTFAVQALTELTTADEQGAHSAILRQLAVGGSRATQAAVYLDIALWCFNTRRHGAATATIALCWARAKELRRRDATVRLAVDVPPLG